MSIGQVSSDSSTVPVESPASGDAAFLEHSVAFAVFLLTLGFALKGPGLLAVLQWHGVGIKLGPECVTLCVHITFYFLRC